MFTETTLSPQAFRLAGASTMVDGALLPRDLHRGKVALITGGSSGIGAQIGRALALCGASVLLASRSADQLARTRDSIVAELREVGEPDAEARVRVEPGCDVGDPAAVLHLAERVLAAFGRVDYVINNAGIVGAEDMVVDMPLDGWRHTLQANMGSNYRLIRALGPQLKASGGYVLNVSSFFGGEKYVAIAYPNRADYAVSKAGQRAMVEALARFLGPEIQINAIAPGPVDGERLRGSASRPGVFDRRARVVLDNKRLNDVYGALVEAHRSTGLPLASLLPLVLRNDVRALMADVAAPHPLRRLAASIWEGSDPEGGSRGHLLSAWLATKLMRRLELGGHVERSDVRPFERTDTPEPFFTRAELEREGGKVRERILGMLHLRRTPTDFDIAVAAAYALADRSVTGETFHPSGGLRFERAVTEGELFGCPEPRALEALRGRTVYLVGDYLRQHLAWLVRAFLDERGAGRVVLLAETDETAQDFLEAFPHHASAGRLRALATNGDLEGTIDRARARFGDPGPVICTPFRPLPRCRLAPGEDGDWGKVLDAEGFDELVERQITHHFRVARKISLIDGAQLVLVTPATSSYTSDEEFALANFVKTTLHAFTATIGAESERTVHHVAVNQIDLTRRSREEEPRGAAEEEEELGRFVDAVLLTSVPVPSPRESRYRSRIMRGNAITV